MRVAVSVLAVALYTVAAQNAKIGPVAFMQAVPVMTLLAVVLMNEKLTSRKGLLVLLSFIGVVLVAVNNPHDLLDFNKGELYSLISGGLFAFTFIARKWQSDALNNQEITITMVGLSFVMNYVLSLVLYHRVFVSTVGWSSQFVVILVATGIISAGSFFLQNYGFQHVSGIVAGSILNLEQVFGPIFGFIFYRENLTAHELAGGVIILLAASMMSWLSSKEFLKAQVPG